MMDLEYKQFTMNGKMCVTSSELTHRRFQSLNDEFGEIPTIALSKERKRLNVCKTQEGQRNFKIRKNLAMESAVKLSCIHKLSTLQAFKKKQNKQMRDKIHQYVNFQRIKLTKVHRIGNFGTVYCAMMNLEQVAVKKIQIDQQHKSRQQFFAKSLKNPYVVQFLGTYYSEDKKASQNKQNSISLKKQQNKTKYLNIVMKKYGNNLYELIHLQNFQPFRLKILLYQMFRSLVYIHSLKICHRDIKPHNFVIKNNRIFLCDFGVSKVLNSSDKNIAYMFSRQYRAPQLLFQFQNYDKSVDMWAMGCVIAEIILKKPLFQGSNNLDQLIKIIKILGSPKWETLLYTSGRVPKIPNVQGTGLQQVFISKCDPVLIKLISSLLKFNTKQRLTAIQALCHPFFDQVREQSFYRTKMKNSEMPNLYYFTKKQIFGNEHFLNKLIPHWMKEHCKRFNIDLKNYHF